MGVFTVEGKILRILGESSENSMNYEKKTFF
jgi:hypothetical protein